MAENKEYAVSLSESESFFTNCINCRDILLSPSMAAPPKATLYSASTVCVLLCGVGERQKERQKDRSTEREKGRQRDRKKKQPA